MNICEKKHHPSWVEINLDHIAHNVKMIKNTLDKSAEIMAVIKADAYAHGGWQVAETILAHGADRIAVAYLKEGIELREKKIDAPILVLGYIPFELMDKIFEYNLIPTVWTEEQADRLSSIADQKGRKLKVHCNVDTGMGRLGVLYSEAAEMIKKINKTSGLEVEGVITHFSAADDKTHPYNQVQIKRFNKVINELKKFDHKSSLIHAANSGAFLNYLTDTRWSMVRVGILLYGLDPASDMTPLKYKPAMSLKSKIANLKTLPRGYGVSYGKTYTTSETVRVAVIPFGYADGYPRLLSNRGEVLINGKRAPVIGRVCMDQFMVKLDRDSRVSVGDEVVLIGSQGDKEITADEIADWAETINYEIVSRIGCRLPRVYIKDGVIDNKYNT